MMISLDDVQEMKLRELAKEKYGDKKGSISEFVSDAIDLAEKEEKRMHAVKRTLARMKKGFDFGLNGRRAYRSRDEIYD